MCKIMCERCAGTNDYSCAQTTDAAFTAAYIALMQSIERKYAASPGSSKPIHFFCVIGAMSATKRTYRSEDTLDSEFARKLCF